MGKEIVTIHLGQAGVQLGNAMWELLCLEHNVKTTGQLRTDVGDVNDSHHTNLYEELSSGKCVPRALLFDMEPTVVDEVRTGSYRCLFNPQYMMSGKEDSGGLFARSYYSQGKEYVNLILDNIRKLVCRCENFTAFQFINSLAGGTGSGMGSLLMEKCADIYGKKFRFSWSVFPSARMSQAMVDPYNCILNTHSSMQCSDCNIIADNETLYQKCVQKLHCYNPTFTLINRLYSQMSTSVFLSHRFRMYGSQHADICELLTNLVPYPRIHFPILAMAPILPPEQMDHETLDVDQLTDTVFLMESQACECDIYRHKFISCAMLYRGDVSISQVYTSLTTMRGNRRINFVDWCPTGFKVAVNTSPPLTLPGAEFAMASRSVTMVAGNVGIKEAWGRLGLKFDLLYGKRAFIHHYLADGMEENEFHEARENINVLEKDYSELAADANEFETADDEMPMSETTTQQPQVEPSTSQVQFSQQLSRSSVEQGQPSSQQSRLIFSRGKSNPSSQAVTKSKSVRSEYSRSEGVSSCSGHDYSSSGRQDLHNRSNMHGNNQTRLPQPSQNCAKREVSFDTNRSALPPRSLDSSIPQAVPQSCSHNTTANQDFQRTRVSTVTSILEKDTEYSNSESQNGAESFLDEISPRIPRVDIDAKKEALEYVRELQKKSRLLNLDDDISGAETISQSVHVQPACVYTFNGLQKATDIERQLSRATVSYQQFLPTQTHDHFNSAHFNHSRNNNAHNLTSSTVDMSSTSSSSSSMSDHSDVSDAELTECSTSPNARYDSCLCGCNRQSFCSSATWSAKSQNRPAVHSGNSKVKKPVTRTVIFT